MEYTLLSESAFLLIALCWVLFQCGSLVMLARWLCPHPKLHAENAVPCLASQANESLPRSNIHRANVSQS